MAVRLSPIVRTTTSMDVMLMEQPMTVVIRILAMTAAQSPAEVVTFSRPLVNLFSVTLLSLSKYI